MSNVGVESSKRLLSFVERIERLTEEKKSLGADIAAVKAEAKAQGYDTKILGDVIKRRAMDSADRQDYDDKRDEYEQMLGMLD